MTEQQILQAAVSKAMENGWHRWQSKESVYRWLDRDLKLGVPFDLIYDHGFARALWSTRKCGGLYFIDTLSDEQMSFIKYRQPAWQYHLQQIVVAEDPIAYLGDNL